ncbi:MAG: hypothetical protein QGH59_00570, partial [Gemmatimonadota bacterium]|nr:hypothetical protein [Gemmatimonadota bacterium]
ISSRDWNSRGNSRGRIVPDRRRFRRPLESLGVALLAGGVRRLPVAGLGALAAVLGWLAFDVLRIRRAVAVGNVLDRIAPPGGAAEAVRIARKSYRITALTFLDLLRIDLIDEDSLWKRVRREDLDRLVAHARSGRCGVLVSGHFGNWELMALAIRRCGLKLNALAGDQANPAVDSRVKKIRGRAGILTHSARTGVRAALDGLGRGEFLATLMDQDARHRGVFVDFLGTPAKTHTGVVVLAARAGVPLIPVALVREGKGQYRFITGEPWEPGEGAAEEVFAPLGAAHFTRFLERLVREHPEHYFWAHRRWKTRPVAEAGSVQQEPKGTWPTG